MPPLLVIRLSEVSRGSDKLLLAPHWKKGIKALLATKAYQYFQIFKKLLKNGVFVQTMWENFRIYVLNRLAATLGLSHDNPRPFLKKMEDVC